MVKKILFFILLLSPIPLFAVQFTARVDHQPVVLGEKFILELKLSDASPQNHPDISDLQKNFIILGRQQSSGTRIVDGNVSTTISWQYILTPKKEGTFTLPSFTVKSSKGTLKSEAISITVTKDTPHSLQDRYENLKLSTHVWTGNCGQDVFLLFLLSSTALMYSASDFAL